MSSFKASRLFLASPFIYLRQMDSRQHFSRLILNMSTSVLYIHVIFINGTNSSITSLFLTMSSFLLRHNFTHRKYSGHECSVWWESTIVYITPENSLLPLSNPVPPIALRRHWFSASLITSDKSRCLCPSPSLSNLPFLIQTVFLRFIHPCCCISHLFLFVV